MRSRQPDAGEEGAVLPANDDEFRLDWGSVEVAIIVPGTDILEVELVSGVHDVLHRRRGALSALPLPTAQAAHHASTRRRPKLHPVPPRAPGAPRTSRGTLNGARPSPSGQAVFSLDSASGSHSGKSTEAADVILRLRGPGHGAGGTLGGSISTNLSQSALKSSVFGIAASGTMRSRFGVNLKV